MIDEKEIIGGIRKGDIKSFELLFRTTYSSLLNYTQSILKDKDTAEDLVQDLFYVLWRDRKKIRITSTLNGYLYRSVYNKSLHYLEHQKVIRKHEGNAKAEMSVANDTPIDMLKYKELHKLITVIIDNLPERCAKIFCMNRFDGLKYAEIADKLSISIKTVEANMGKALKEFRKELLKYER